MKRVKLRRRAINCKLVEESKTNPGYFKYLITIKEKDGKVHEVPTYGIDMQDAIKRLLKVESSERIHKTYINKIEPISILATAFTWILSILLAAMIDDYRYAFYGTISIFSILTIFLTYRFFKDY